MAQPDFLVAERVYLVDEGARTGQPKATVTAACRWTYATANRSGYRRKDASAAVRGSGAFESNDCEGVVK